MGFWKNIVEAQKAANLRERIGVRNAAIICPHCQRRGAVYVKPIKAKQGISGAKATGAVLTGGVSLIATGLSRKQPVTKATCTDCQSTWTF
jgi:hypothetical protein